ncbi:MAG: WecB/TagA/CpsF family glycosyltransferase [Myxococcota bacterium]|nr:WecB/TagA/CpsF family glycosyltransferase [Myxococcota bacterium]
MDRVDVLGLPVDVLTEDSLLDEVEARIVDGGHHTVAYLNVHVANVAAKDPELTRFLQEVDLCYCDGEGIRLGARLLGQRLPSRMTGADWIWSLAARAEGRWKIAWIGGEPGVTHQAAAVLQHKHPKLEMHCDHGFYRNDRYPQVIDAINAAEPHILLVGMGSPLQEQWVTQWRSEVHAPVVWCLGATADFISGKVSRGPALLHQRQEWLARLLVDPQRLWSRYLIGNSRFLGRVLRSRLRN